MSLRAAGYLALDRLGPPWRAHAAERASRPGADTGKPVRAYFGSPHRLRGVGGPQIRTQRMIREFGNRWLAPELIYANSAGTVPLERIERLGRGPARPRIVYNQNGLYFRAWYAAGDLEARNAVMRRYHELADLTIFQSEFCRVAFAELTGVASAAGVVLHNAVPDPLGGAASPPERRSSGRPSCLLTAAFGGDGEHLLLPAISAFEILHDRRPRECPELVLAGPWLDSALRSEWYARVRERLERLEALKVVRRIGVYEVARLPELAARAWLALHLRDKDACPNAVVERMALGLGHVFARSGGTPELVGPAGIGLEVGRGWDRFHEVQPEELASAIERGLDRAEELGRQARSRFLAELDWPGYVARHRELFADVLAGRAPGGRA